MNVIVVPDTSMIVIPLIEKNGHTYLSPSNFSRYDNMDICEGNFVFDNLINKYSSSELPSGLKGRLYLFSRVVDKADAAIILGKRPKNRHKMYNALNDLILFGGNACNNAHSLTKKKKKNLDDFQNSDDLSVDLTLKKEKYPLTDVKKILDNLI